MSEGYLKIETVVGWKPGKMLRRAQQVFIFKQSLNIVQWNKILACVGLEIALWENESDYEKATQILTILLCWEGKYSVLVFQAVRVFVHQLPMA